MLDVFVAQVRLKAPGIVPLVGQRKAAGMAQHMGMRLELEPGRFAGALDHAGEACGRKRSAALRRKDEGRFRFLLALKPAEGAHLVAADRVRAGRALLGPADGQGCRIEIDLVPAA